MDTRRRKTGQKPKRNNETQKLLSDVISKILQTMKENVKQGGYCMTMIYGVLPPAMAWAAMTNRENEEKKTNQKAISTTRPVLLGVGLFACGIILEQIFHDLSMLHF